MTWLLYPLAILAGLMNPIQSGCNGMLNKVLQRPMLAGAISSSGTFLTVLAVTAVAGQFGLGGKAAEVPWWAWCGGLAGAVVLLAQPVAAQKLGAAPFIGLTVTAGVVASVLFDHFGLLGFQQHTASAGRLIGAALMILGVGLVALL